MKYAGVMFAVDALGWLALGAGNYDRVDRRIPGGGWLDHSPLGPMGIAILLGNGMVVHCLRGACDRYSLGYSAAVRIVLPALVSGIVYMKTDRENTDKIGVAGDVASDTWLALALAGTALDYIYTLANPDLRTDTRTTRDVPSATWLLSPTRRGGVVGLAGSF